MGVIRDGRRINCVGESRTAGQRLQSYQESDVVTVRKRGISEGPFLAGSVSIEARIVCPVFGLVSRHCEFSGDVGAVKQSGN